MTLEICESCQHYMREYSKAHKCPNCGATKPVTVYNSYHGRASLYPNHTSTRTVLAPGFIKLFFWVAVMLILIMALAALSDPVLQSVRGGI